MTVRPLSPQPIRTPQKRNLGMISDLPLMGAFAGQIPETSPLHLHLESSIEGNAQ